jgi:hypothetical protein
MKKHTVLRRLMYIATPEIFDLERHNLADDCYLCVIKQLRELGLFTKEEHLQF